MEIQILIFGKSRGSKEAAKEIGAEYIPNVKCNEEGTPLLGELFKEADRRAQFSIMTFLNADIILPENFLNTIEIVSKKFKKFLMIGHRWDMDINYIIDLKNENGKEKFWNSVVKNSKKHPCTGIDYFVYRRGMYKDIPDLVIGRWGYDNWLVWKARRNLISVIDSSNSICAVHQNHPYSNTNPKSGMEYNSNQKIIEGKMLNILDATYKLENGKIINKTEYEERIRYLHRLPFIFPEFALPINFFRRVYKKLVVI